MHVLLSDTSVLMDLERGALLETAFRLPFSFVVSDLLYKRELEALYGQRLKALGLHIESLDSCALQSALRFRKQELHLSLPDAFALTLANLHGWILLTGDSALRKFAQTKTVHCHDVLWLLEQMHRYKCDTPEALYHGLKTISAHPRCRLPQTEIREQLRFLHSSREWPSNKMALVPRSNDSITKLMRESLGIR